MNKSTEMQHNPQKEKEKLMQVYKFSKKLKKFEIRGCNSFKYVVKYEGCDMTDDEAGGCCPSEAGFSVENVRFMKPGGSHCTT